MVADTWGVETTLRAISVLPLLPWGIVLMLPSAAKAKEAPVPQMQVATAK